jgi:beta-glucosidase
MKYFPEGFEFGVATASYQIEGAGETDGRSPSVWDAFAAREGAVYQGHNGSVACDHYHRYKEDIALMKQLGIGTYRLSLAWPRIIPGGTGDVNRKGIEFYRALLTEIRQAGIEPAVTLYHWDHPQVLEEFGGWRDRRMALAYGEYAKVCFDAFGDLVSRWITINEPFCIAHLSYFMGQHAPGLKLGVQDLFNTVHHVNLAHGLAVDAFRKGGYQGEIGITLNMITPRPATGTPEDRRAADLYTDFNTRLFTDPLYRGTYPSSLATSYPDASFPVQPGDMELIGAKTDFIGVNFYNESAVKADPAVPEGYSYAPDGYEKTAMGWPVTPLGLLRQLRWLHKEYAPGPIYITENGAAYPDQVTEGRVHDRDRIEYLRRHFAVCVEAVEEGIPLKGYYLWSFMDNFEWSHGYSKRFGIVYVDYETQKRIPKDSFYYYREVVNGYEGF